MNIIAGYVFALFGPGRHFSFRLIAGGQALLGLSRL